MEVEGVHVKSITFDIEEGRQLILALKGDAGVDIMHQCGSYAHCVTCLIEFLEGEPEEMKGRTDDPPDVRISWRRYAYLARFPARRT